LNPNGDNPNFWGWPGFGEGWGIGEECFRVYQEQEFFIPRLGFFHVMIVILESQMLSECIQFI
jgi:hypothetical protein